MKKVFLNCMLLLCALIVGTNAWAEEQTLWSENFGSYSTDQVPSAGTYSYVCTNGTKTSGSTNGGTTAVKNENLAEGTKPELLVGKKGSGTSAVGGSFTAVVPLNNIEGTITLKYKQNANSLKVTMTAGLLSATQTTSSKAEQTLTLANVTTSHTSVTIQFQATSTSNVRLDDIVLKGSPADIGDKTDCDLALTGAPIALSFDLYDDADAQVINYTTTSTGAVTVSASEYINAVVNETAKTITVTPLKKTASTQTITVNQAADATYAAGSQTFTVSIDDSTPIETFKKIESADDLAVGDELIFVYETGEKSAGTIGSNSYLASVSVEIESDEIGVKNGDGVNVFVLGGESGAWTFYSKLDDGYLYSSAAKSVGIQASEASWSISINSTKATITANSLANNNLQYNAASPRFCAYTSNQSAIQIYRKVVERTTVTVGDAGYTTYVTKGKVAFPVGVTAYIATAASGSAITLQSIASAPANTAVIIQATPGDHDLGSAASPVDCSSNILKASDGYKKGNGSIYALGKKNEVVGFYLVENDATIPAGKAYLVYPENNNAPSMLCLVEEETGATNIDATKAVEEGVKFMENGKLFIKKNGIVYDMLGTVVR